MTTIGEVNSGETTSLGAVQEEIDSRINIGESSTDRSDQPIPIFYDESQERRAVYLTSCVPLYHAAIKGDWEAAKSVIDDRHDVVRFGISCGLDTALHIAAAAKHANFVEKLVNRMTRSDLALKNRSGNTAICYAAVSGIVKTAKVMYERNNDLPMIRGRKGWTPLYMAALFGQRDMISFLFEKTDFRQLSEKERIELLLAVISADYYDVALDILERDTNLALARDHESQATALHLLARKASAMGTRSKLGIWKRSINSSLFFKCGFLFFKGIYHKALMQTLAYQLVENLWNEIVKKPANEISDLIRTPSRLLFDAAELGNVEFLVVLFRSYPDLLWKVDDDNRSLFHIAVQYRHESIFNLIYELGAIKDLIAAYKDDMNNNILHLAGKLAPPNRLQIVSGSALQMQRELLWFKAVEKIVPPSYRMMKNKVEQEQTPSDAIPASDVLPESDTQNLIDKHTPRELFSESHNMLLKEGEKWMKDTAASSMLVATLIATVVFAAPFTVPGGNNSETGTPIFQRENWFTIFVISDAVALIFSTFSILMFLSILTARYTEEDFFWSLPSRLVFGLSALFISIATMLLAFSAIFFLVYDHRLKWIPTLIIFLASSVVILFAFLHYSLWFDIIHSTLRSRFLFQPHKCCHRLY